MKSRFILFMCVILQVTQAMVKPSYGMYDPSRETSYWRDIYPYQEAPISAFSRFAVLYSLSQVYEYTYTHTHLHTYIHTHIHTHIHTYTHTYTYTHRIHCDMDGIVQAQIPLSLHYNLMEIGYVTLKCSTDE